MKPKRGRKSKHSDYYSDDESSEDDESDDGYDSDYDSYTRNDYVDSTIYHFNFHGCEQNQITSSQNISYQIRYVDDPSQQIGSEKNTNLLISQQPKQSIAFSYLPESVSFPQRAVSLSIVFPSKYVTNESTNHYSGLISAFSWLTQRALSCYAECKIVFQFLDGSLTSCEILHDSTVGMINYEYIQDESRWYTIPAQEEKINQAFEFCQNQIGKGFNSTGFCAIMIPILGYWIPYDAKGSCWFSSELCMTVLQIVSEQYSEYKPCKTYPRLLENILQIHQRSPERCV